MDSRDRRFESVYSKKVRAGRRRTYFFDVRKTKGSDYYLTITESTRRFDGDGYNRHKIFLYKEDFNRFIEGMVEAVDHVKTELMPDYDYDEYARRYEEDDEDYSARKVSTAESTDEVVETAVEKDPILGTDIENDEDLKW